jgi:hypothetical protein
MKRSQIVEAVREVLKELSTTGGVGGYSTPFAFSKKGAGTNAATKATQKLGFKPVKMKKRPYDTKAFTYLSERGAGPYVTPNAFTSEAGMYDQDAVKYMEEQGMEVIGKPKNPSKKTIQNYSDKKNN